MKISGKEIIYMDNAATSWPKPPGMADAVSEFITQRCANPGRSAHAMSVDTARMIFSVRDSVADLLGCDNPERIVFTSNATSALNTAVFGLLGPDDHIITTGMEHNSVMRPLRALEKSGAQITVIKCSQDGSPDPVDIKKALRSNTRAVVMTHASNVTGTVMPVKDVAEITGNSDIIFIVDGAQSAGTVPVNPEKDGIDIFAFTGHKSLMGPQGTGGLYIRKGLENSMRPFMQGGTGSFSEKEEQPEFMPDKFESGTPNSPGIAGLGAAISFIREKGIENIAEHERYLTKMLIDGLSSIKGVTMYGPALVDRRTSVVSVNIDGISSSEVSQILDEDYAIMTRPGLHCAPAAHRTIGTFSGGTVRLSPGYFTTQEEIISVLDAVSEIAVQKIK